MDQYLIDIQTGSSVGNFTTISSTYRQNIKRIFNSLFEWKNLPTGLKSKYFENFLFTYGTVVFYKVGEEFIVLPTTIEKFNKYYEWVVGKAFSPAVGENKETGNKRISIDGRAGTLKGVFIYNNSDKLPTLFGSQAVLWSLDAVWKAIRVDAINAKNSRLLPVSSNAKGRKALNFINQAQLSTSAIIPINEDMISKVSGLQSIESPSKQQDLWSSYRNLLQELMTNLGLPADTRADKKERVLTEEINVGMFQATHLLREQLEMRENAVKSINEAFGTNIEVILSPDADAIVNKVQNDILNSEQENIKTISDPYERVSDTGLAIIKTGDK